MFRRIWVLIACSIMLAAGCTQSTGPGTPPSSSATAATTRPHMTPTATPPGSASDTVPETRRGGTVVIGSMQEPPVLNPLLPGGDNEIVRAIDEAILAGAYDIDPGTGLPRPDLVAEIPTVRNGDVTIGDDGAMTVTWRIHPDATWSDGTPMSGADFAFTLDVLRQLGLEPGTPADTPPALDLVTEQVVAPDSITITFSKPTIEYVTLFDTVLPSHLIPDAAAVTTYTNEIWPSAGPFLLDTWEQGNFIRLRRNPNYWRHDANDNRLPYLDEVVIRFFPDAEGLAAALQGGTVDVAAGDATEVARLLSSSDGTSHLELGTVQGPVFYALVFGYEPGLAPPQNLLLSYRRALAEMIDQGSLGFDVFRNRALTIDSTIDATEARPWSFIGSRHANTADILEPTCRELGRRCDTDPIAANLFILNPDTNRRGEVATALSAQLDAPELDMNLELFTGFIDCFSTCPIVDLEVATLPKPAGVPDILDFFDHIVDTMVGFGRMASSAEPQPFSAELLTRYRAIIDEMQTTADIDHFLQLAEEAEQILADSVAFIPLASHPFTTAVATRVGGLEPEHITRTFTADIENWFLNDE